MAADVLVGGTRALLGQGLGMGWGDEAEAWLRAKAGEGRYEDILRKIREEYGQYSQENPFTAGLSEFAGGAAPSVAAMMLPGGQPMAAANAGRLAASPAVQKATAGALAKLAALGAGTGAVAGAGSAEEGSRASGAVTGGVGGGVAGAVLPSAMRGAGAGLRWLQERLAPTEAVIANRAAQKMTGALEQSGMSPKDISARMAKDRAMGVPSVVANVSPGAADLAEAVAQRTGRGARKIEEALTEQKVGAKERTYSQVNKRLNPGNYYDDLAKLQAEMRTLSGPAYEKAYSHGEVTDPKVLQYLQLPQFQQGMKEAERLLAAEGRTFDASKPTVEVLDQVKRGIDALIERETDPVTGKTSALGRVYTQKKNEFLTALDKAVPDYELARGIYRGGAELQDAMRKGINEFGRMDHEQVQKLVGGMSASEKEAFRTGVARDLYSKIMDGSTNFNAAQRIIGSPETQAKLQPLFDNSGQFNLFKAALERESQLFNQANKVLGGSATGKRTQMREELEGGPGVGTAVADAVTGGFWGSLGALTTRALRAGTISEQTADKLAGMLMSKDPHEVAAVVKLLEDHAAAAAPKVRRASAAEAGAVTGTAAAAPMSPEPPREEKPLPKSIEQDIAPAAGQQDARPAIERDMDQ